MLSGISFLKYLKTDVTSVVKTNINCQANLLNANKLRLDT